MADRRMEPVSRVIQAAPVPPVADDDYHCPNCAFLPTASGGGFWACQNLCIRE